MAKVLVVDDHASNRDLIVTLLKHAGHESIEAADGQAALEQVRTGHPDLVVCDILMPTMDGYEFVRSLRADPAVADTEVIFCTATFLEKEARRLAQSCGVSQVLLKPCEPEEVLRAISMALSDATTPELPTDDVVFGREHRRLLADKLVENAEQLELANRRLSALNELNVQLASERDPQALLDKVCRGARDLLGARFAVLGVEEADHAAPTPVTTSGVTDADSWRMKQSRSDPRLPRAVMLEHAPRRFDNPGGDPLAIGLTGDYPPVHFGLIAPIASLTRVHGWILLIDKLGAEGFSEDDERLLSSLAAQTGRIYENDSLYEEMWRNAERLRESELRFRQLAENIREVFFLENPCGTQTFYVSRAYEEIFGRSCASLYADSSSWKQAIHPDDRDAALPQTGPSGAFVSFDREYRIVRPDNSVRSIRSRGFPIRDAAGQVYRVAGIAEDITEQVRLREDLREREAGLHRAQMLAKLAHVVTRPDGSFESWSDNLPLLAGLVPAQMPGSTREWLELLHPEDRENFRSTSVAAALSASHRAVDYRLQRHDGEWIDIHQEIEPLPGRVDAAGKLRWFSTLQDVTVQRRAEQKIRRLNRVYAVLSGINTLIVRVRNHADLFRESCRIAVEVGAYRMAWIGTVDATTQDGGVVASCSGSNRYLANLRLSLRDESPHASRPANRALRSMQPAITNDIMADASLAPLHEELRALGLRSQGCFPLLVEQQAIGVMTLCSTELDAFDDDEVRLLLELAGDIAFAFDHIRKDERLNHLSYYDALTGLANASLLDERLAQAIAGAGDEQPMLALALIDVERFKTINDTFGRHGGDALLKQIAERLSEGLDTRTPVARIGADHFAIVIPDERDEAGVARLLAEQYRRCFVPPFEIGGQELRIAAKIGIALYPNDGHDAESLHRNAEAALNKAKLSSERVLFYDPRMTEAVAEKLELENRLRLALEREEFVLHYQPKVDVDSRCIEGVEALIRWNAPGIGLVPPLKFIPLLEETGLIVEVGLWALRRAALDHQAWREQGLAAPRIAVNVSAVQLRRPDFVVTVEALLKQHAGQPHGIDIELTESLIMEDIEANIASLHALRALGMQLAIDDFGTGYSSLAYLAKLPAQALKIDRAFIITMLDEPNNMTLVSTMISLAHSLRMKVIAEGVETEEQAKMLRLLRCDQIQGYLVSRPVPFEAMSDLIRQQPPRSAGT